MPTAMPPQMLGLVPVMRVILFWSCMGSLALEVPAYPHPSPPPSRGRGQSHHKALGEKRRKALIRVEQVGLNPGCLGWFPAQLGHGPRQTHPVEKLLLTALLDCGQRRLTPGGVITRAQGLVQGPVTRDIRIEEIGLARQEGMRPTGRGNERHPPGTPGEHAGTRGAEIKTAPGHW